MESMERGSKEVEEGSAVVAEALTALNLIGNKVAGVAAAMQEISASTQEQLSSSEKVQKSIAEVNSFAEKSAASSEEVSASIQQTTSSMQQVATASQNLSHNAEDLSRQISQFHLDLNSGKFEEVRKPVKHGKKSEDIEEVKHSVKK